MLRGPRADLREKLEAYERALIVAPLEATQGNRTEAARMLDIGRATLHDTLKEDGVAREEEAE